MPPDIDACPCGSGDLYGSCCGRLHRCEVEAATAEQLMRARYSAFAVGDEAFLLRSWHPSTCPPAVGLDPADRWLGLEVVATDAGGPLDETGTVEFRATVTHGAGRPHVLHEVSRFERHAHRWVYVGPALRLSSCPVRGPQSEHHGLW